MEDCIFCKIVSGEIPSQRLYEDDDTFVFLDINPLQEGHTLVIPKIHTRDLFDTDADVYMKIMKAVQQVGPAIKTVTGAEGFNVIANVGSAAGQTVFHTHFHIVPRYENDDIVTWNHKGATQEELIATAEKIRTSL